MNDELKKERERFAASDSLERLLGNIDFAKADGLEGKSYFEDILMKDFKIVMSYLTEKSLTSEDENHLKEDIEKMIELRERVIREGGGSPSDPEHYAVTKIRVPGFNNHNLCLTFDINGVGHEFSPEIHQLMDSLAPEVKDKSGNIPATMLWVGFLDENKDVDQDSGSLCDKFVTKLDDIVPSYHPRMREEIPDYSFGG